MPREGCCLLPSCGEGQRREDEEEKRKKWSCTHPLSVWGPKKCALDFIKIPRGLPGTFKLTHACLRGRVARAPLAISWDAWRYPHVERLQC